MRKKDLPYFDFNSAVLNIIKSDMTVDKSVDVSGIVKLGDLKYYNYAIDADAINQLFKKGLENKKAVDEKEKKYSNFNMLSAYELEKNQIKEL
jgi:hypothetical protein